MNRRKSFDDLRLIVSKPVPAVKTKHDEKNKVLLTLSAAILLAYCNLYNYTIKMEWIGSFYMMIYFTLMYACSWINFRVTSPNITNVTLTLNLLSCIGNDYDILNNNAYIISYTCQLMFIIHKIQNKSNSFDVLFNIFSLIGFIAYHVHIFQKYHFIFISVCAHFFNETMYKLT